MEFFPEFPARFSTFHPSGFVFSEKFGIGQNTSTPAATPPSRSRAVSPPHHPATLQAVAGRRSNASTPVLLSSAMSNLARSNSLPAARKAVPSRCRRTSISVWGPCCQTRRSQHLRLKTAAADPLLVSTVFPPLSQSNLRVCKVNVGVSSASCSVAQNEDTVPPNQEANHLSNEEIIALDDEDAEAEGEEVGGTTGKRKKRCTSAVWQYFTKKTVVVEVDGKKYEQLWGYCNFPKCSARYRAESVNGTNAFRSHLRSTHSIVKGQLQLKTERDRGKDVTLVQAFKYDLETSIKKFYLAIIMHEYPFNMVEHEYFVDALMSLRPNFAFKSRVTAKKDIMDMYTEEKDKLYDLMKKMPSRFSATMDVWILCQNKSYMCVTLHWIDDDWKIQKRIVALFHLEGRHTGHRLAQAFTEVLVKWFVEKKMFALTLDNASNNLVAVTDIIEDFKLNGNGSLVCDGIFFHIRCACHILNLVAKDGMAVISKQLEKIKALVLAVKGSPLQWEELMKCAAQCGLDTSKGIKLDVSTRWNSTYMMLRDALYYKPAFIRLKIANRRKYEKISPSDTDWGMAATIFQCLEIFYDLTALLSGRQCIPSIVADLKPDDTMEKEHVPLNDDSESDPDEMDDAGEL
ncbi:Unknown protein [Striga hermonthica]|uniref:Uncharacterized protein n=1 Tax=Striga hermonthica TaxID=68872 RepID=A0A9N7MZ39_STRHE|nr:Unknown protein [Striga hermonthica]